MTIDAMLDALVSYLTGCLSTGTGLMPGVVSVQKGDAIVPDGAQPVVTVDWDGEDLGGDRGLTVFSSHQVAFRLYISSMKKGEDAHGLVRSLYDGGTVGLRKALLSAPPLGFSMTLGQAQRINMKTRPDLRFSAGIEVLALVKMVGGR